MIATGSCIEMLVVNEIHWQLNVHCGTVKNAEMDARAAF